MTPTLLSPTMGNDPELFVKMGNRLIPSEKIITSKHKKIKIDNAAIELQPGPKECLQEQNKAIANSLALVQKALKEKKFDKAHISLRPVEQLRAEDIAECSSVCLFGCQPSLVFDGKDLRRSAPNINPKKVRYRSVGYHVHIGSTHPDEISFVYRKDNPIITMAKILHSTEGRVRLVQVCDLLVGLPAVLLERDPRVALRRQTLGYGQAGEFREQPHGFEYRTLGSWPLLQPMWGWWANAAVRDALHIVVFDQDQALKEGLDLAKVAQAINTNNLVEALPLWNQVKKNLQAISKLWTKAWGPDTLEDSYPILSELNLQRFEFLAAKQVLRGKLFSFSKWCKRVRGGDWDEYKPRAFYQGFSNGAQEVIATTPTMEPDWQDFHKNWAWDRDLISKPLLA